MADFKRKPGESFEGFLRKFKKGLKNSKRLEKARSKQHLIPKKSKRQQKNYALNSISMRQEKEYLRKIGKLEETQNR
jgi:ribosomal protein S21